MLCDSHTLWGGDVLSRVSSVGYRDRNVVRMTFSDVRFVTLVT